LITNPALLSSDQGEDVIPDIGRFSGALATAWRRRRWGGTASVYAVIQGEDAGLSTRRPDKLEVLELLLASGADVGQRGVNDWTPLHYAVVERDAEAVRLLLAHGADPMLKTRIDDCTSPLEDAEAVGFTAGAELMHAAFPGRG